MRIREIIAQKAKRSLLLINVSGGILVLGSYIYGVATYDGSTSDLWGGVSDSLLPLYTTFIFLAAIGYFLFTYYVFFHISLGNNRVRPFIIIYSLILFPSALWMPLTVNMLENPSDILLLLIRVVLAVVGISSIALLVAVLKNRNKGSQLAFTLSILGSILFIIQTLLFDAILWSINFTV